MKIRQARLEDLDRIVEIELENFSIEEAIPRSVFEAHLREIQTSFLVAEKEGRIMGYIEGPVWTIPSSARPVFYRRDRRL